MHAGRTTEIDVFWENFLQALRKRGVKEAARRWYVIHAENYIKRHEGTRLKDHTPANVEDYAEVLGGKPGIRSWQYIQAIESLQILFEDIVQPDWARAFDWDAQAAGAPLTPDHSTIAREQMDTEKSGRACGLEARERRELDRQFGDLFEAIRNEIRRRHYSIRTEKTYTDWTRRFIAYTGKRHPSDVNTSLVSAFLEHLAIERNVAPSTQNQALCAIVFLYEQVHARA